MPSPPEVRQARARERYAEYKGLCLRLGVGTQRTYWWRHYAELQEMQQRPRLTKDEMFAYWREVFTEDEIREIGGGLHEF